MKKIILLIIAAITFTFTMQSCGSKNANQDMTKKADSTAMNMKSATADTSKTASATPEKTMYKCPGCGKIFDKPGKCPECGMTLVPVKS